jgi:ribonuclease III
VRKETCARSREIGLGEVLKLGRSEMMSGGRRKDALLGDAMEAVIAAVYLDAGFDAARALVLRLWGQPDRAAWPSRCARPEDLACRNGRRRAAAAAGLSMEMGARPRPCPGLHRVESGWTVAKPKGAGRTKRQAEQAAARALLARMEAGDD